MVVRGPGGGGGGKGRRSHFQTFSSELKNNKSKNYTIV